MRLLTLILLVCIVAGCSNQANTVSLNNSTAAHAQTPLPESENTPDKAAQRGLGTLRKLATEQTFADLGFQSLAEVERTTLAPSFRVFFVRLDKLREYSAGDNTSSMLTDSKRFLYPVLVDGDPRSSITVEQLNGRWEAVSFGGGVVAEYAKLREMKSGAEQREYVVVQIPAMQLNFLGRGVGGSELVLTPLPSNADADASESLFQRDIAIVGEKATHGSVVVDSPSERYSGSILDRKASVVFSKLAPKAKAIRDDVPR